ncbi:hypothetical protein UPYG_G00108050 [Umbra pygmaea]|uniref:RRM domain-containing protein n=1 Tax=Umbra pygmaea TaxID=75934 RepID=A0ABD0X3A6_UMBPY
MLTKEEEQERHISATKLRHHSAADLSTAELQLHQTRNKWRRHPQSERKRRNQRTEEKRRLPQRKWETRKGVERKDANDAVLPLVAAAALPPAAVLAPAPVLPVDPGRRRHDNRRRSRSASKTQKKGEEKERRRRSPSPKPTKVHLGRLTRNVTKEHIQEIFATYGKIKMIDMPVERIHPHLSRGYAYVEYETPEEAQKALKYMDGGQIDGQEITASAVLTPRIRPPPRRPSPPRRMPPPPPMWRRTPPRMRRRSRSPRRRSPVRRRSRSRSPGRRRHRSRSSSNSSR